MEVNLPASVKNARMIAKYVKKYLRNEKEVTIICSHKKSIYFIRNIFRNITLKESGITIMVFTTKDFCMPVKNVIKEQTLEIQPLSVCKI